MDQVGITNIHCCSSLYIKEARLIMSRTDASGISNGSNKLSHACVCPGILASGGEDGIICVWDLHRKPSHGLEAKVGADCPQELLFQHAGHKCGVRIFSF